MLLIMAKKHIEYVYVSPSYGIKAGDVITIAGVKKKKDGTVITNCKKGKETKFVAKINYG